MHLVHKDQGGPHGATVCSRLLDEIRAGVLQPGARLLETELADALRHVRERRCARRSAGCEADGLVTHMPRAGAVVRTLDYAEIMELYEMRVVLEGAAARLAARAASEVELDELDAITDEMLAADGDGAALFALNQQFHRALLDAARNRFLVQVGECGPERRC